VLIAVNLVLTLFGVILGMYVEGWELVTSLYVVAQVATTVGYGDVTVAHTRMKLFMSFYIMFCLVSVAYAVNLAHEQAVSWRNKHLIRWLETVEGAGAQDSSSQREIKHKYEDLNKVLTSSFSAFIFIFAGTIFYWLEEPCSCSYGHTLVPAPCDDSTLQMCIDTGGRTLSLIEAFYMSVVTLTTVGFGDHTPQTRIGRVFGIVWMILGFGLILDWVGSLAEYFFLRESLQRFDKTPEMSEELFQLMDKDRNGYVTRQEYMQSMLLAYGMIDQEVLDRLDRQFDSLALDKAKVLTRDALRSKGLLT